ncbi:MAG: hypothetical protein HC905_31330 [Bacteroidales bacterium]|nr:hypothetical protein [Bacteroidales bacterium]
MEDGTFESQFTSYMFCGLNGMRDSVLMSAVKKEWENNNYTKDGAYVAPNDIANTKNFMKKLLNKKYGIGRVLKIRKYFRTS